MTGRQQLSSWGVPALLSRYPKLRIIPDDGCALLLRGSITFIASGVGLETLTDTYMIAIRVPTGFSRAFPCVYDEGHRIDRRYHRLDDGSFCLGSPIRIRLYLAQSHDLLEYVERFVIPYLYGYSYFEKHGYAPFGELAHGDQGLVEDFKTLFGLKTARASAEMLALIGMKKRDANKRLCPCDSGLRLGRCHHIVVNQYRVLLGRLWCRNQATWICEEYLTDGEVDITGPLEDGMKGNPQRKTVDHRPMPKTSADDLQMRLATQNPIEGTATAA